MEREKMEGQGVAASPPLSHPFGAEPVPVSGKAGIANATCIITNCRRRAPSGEPFCSEHRS